MIHKMTTKKTPPVNSAGPMASIFQQWIIAQRQQRKQQQQQPQPEQLSSSCNNNNRRTINGDGATRVAPDSVPPAVVATAVVPKSSSWNRINYRILLQMTAPCSLLQDRTLAAQPIEENKHVYHRAGQLTPSEIATKDMWGGSAWLLYLMEQLCTAIVTFEVDPSTMILDQNENRHHHQQSDSSVADLSPTPTPQVLFISTLPQAKEAGTSTTAWIHQFLPSHFLHHVQVLDLSTDNPWGWDNDEDDNDDENDGDETIQQCQQQQGLLKEENIGNSSSSSSSTTIGMDNLVLLQHHLRQKQQQHRQPQPMILIWQSLVPLIQVHGVPQVLRMLQTLPGLQIWTVPISCWSSADYVLLEDAASCLLQIQHGVATLLRRGIREPDNVQRETIPYELRAITKTTTMMDSDDGTTRRCPNNDNNNNNNNNNNGIVGLRYYQVVVGMVEKSTRHEQKVENVRPSDTISPSITSTRTIITPATTTSITGNSHSSLDLPNRGHQAARRVQLQLEEEGEEDKYIPGKKVTTTTTTTTTFTPKRPQIYMDDDDPEFDDLDEEDPDDDLDI
jgi:hypothetical protein